MKNRPEMLMSHCDDEDESASSAARHKGEFGLIRSWPVGVFRALRLRPRMKKSRRGGGASTGEAVSLASPCTWRRTGANTKAPESFTPPEVGDGFPARSPSRRAGLESLLANSHLHVKVNRSAVATATGSHRRGTPLPRRTR